MSDGSPGHGTVTRTGPVAIAEAVVLGGLVCWLGVLAADRLLHWFVPVPSWWVAVVAGLIAVAVLVVAWDRHRVTHVLGLATTPRLAVTILVSAKACVLGGALLAGAYASLALQYVSRWGTEAGRARVVHGGVCALAAVFLVVAGVVLERECQRTHGGEPGPGDE